LLAWHEAHSRCFPWRETRDAYPILLAEVLLQRTQAIQVERSFRGFLREFPKPEILARAPTTAVEEAIRPLGLAKRASTLKLMGEALVQRHRGCVPATLDELLLLPGVGRYVAVATLCFAFGARLGLVDANVIRVLGRYFSVHSERSRPRDDPELWNLATRLTPRHDPATYNRALIDFASLVCTPRSPRCSHCPLGRTCDAVHGLQGP